MVQDFWVSYLIHLSESSPAALQPCSPAALQPAALQPCSPPCVRVSPSIQIKGERSSQPRSRSRPGSGAGFVMVKRQYHAGVSKRTVPNEHASWQANLAVTLMYSRLKKRFRFWAKATYYHFFPLPGNKVL